MDKAKDMLLADAIECCIESELKIRKLKAIIIMLGTVNIVLAFALLIS